MKHLGDSKIFEHLRLKITLWAILAMAVLAPVACASPAAPAPEQPVRQAATNTAVPTEPSPNLEPTEERPTATVPVPTGQEVIHVGVVESVDAQKLVLSTTGDEVTLTLSGQTQVQVFREAALGDLEVGQRVTIVGSQAGAGLSASSIVVTMEGTSLYEDLGEVQVGRGRLGYIGNIVSIGDGTIELTTNQGPRVATVSAAGTTVQMPAASIETELTPGQLVTVIGEENPGGGITARSVLITPEMGPLMSGGRRGGGRRGGGAGAFGERSTATPVPEFDPSRQAGEYQGISFAVAPGSEASFIVRERLALLLLPNKVTMRTNALSGVVRLDGGASEVVIDLRQLVSGQRLRDGYVRRNMFSQHPKAIFNIDDVGQLPPGLAHGREAEIQRTGLLQIRGVEVPLGFDLTVQDMGGEILVQGRTKFSWEDFGMDAPTAGVVLSVSDQVDVVVNLTLKPLR